MSRLLSAFAALGDNYPRTTALVGTVTGWTSVNLLHAAQITAAALAALVSLCALILSAPKAVAEVRRWFR